MIKVDYSKKDTIIFGNYCNDRKCGDWVYKYDKDSLVYNYNDSTIKYISKGLLSSDSANVKVEDKFILKKVDSPAILIGYPYFIANKIKYNEQFKTPYRGNNAVVSFVIDTSGNVKDIKIEKSINEVTDGSLIDNVKEKQLKWLPARINRQPVEFKVCIEIMHVGSNDNLPKELLVYTVFSHFVFFICQKG